MTEARTFVARTLATLERVKSGYARPQPAAAGVDLNVGEARFALPDHVRAEMAERVQRLTELGYSNPAGEPELRAAYLRHLALDAHGRTLAEDTDVLVTAGGKEAVWLAVELAMDAGQARAVLLPRPGWEPYGLWSATAGCPVVDYDPAAVAQDPDVLLDTLRRAPIRPGLLLLNYPHNPTGVGIDQQRLDRLVEIARDAGLRIVSDEVYRTFADEPASVALSPAFDADQDLVADSTSKWLGMAGLRVGFLHAGSSQLAKLTQVRATYASCTSVLAQHVTASLLSSSTAQKWLGTVREEIAATRGGLARELTARGVSVVSGGGLYVWARRPRPADIPDGVGNVPAAAMSDGSGFGAPGHIRLCVAREGLDPARAASAVLTSLKGC
ncbi:pyridoxal phosphate-dependent aminotransferase [Streptomyces mirabilis]|uniref:pyridoxal phosphate-dependent aminotransferase n=1 Tax=Streptomyces mirabilis TaxID=68239 RepID=UPI0036AC7402